MIINTVKLVILMAVLTALFMVAGNALGGRSGMTMALVAALGINFFAYWFSDKVALSMSRASEVSVAEAPDLHALVESLARRAGLPKPGVYIIPVHTPNAFATGRNPNNSAIAVTEGLLRLLKREELEGVLAHEFAHIRNRDILISSIAAVMAGAISYLATMAQWSMIFGGLDDDDDDDGGFGLLGIVLMMIVAPVAAVMIQMAISRGREYFADATGAAICGQPLALADALQRLDDYNLRLPMNINPATAQMYIVNPLSGGTLNSLFSTHPPVYERVQRLSRLAG